ncbi:LacI family DNA-binding transcriptional regulator [Actinomyces urogenitalis]|uniref:LacI family DNA-binding transcriptional regulator n=1 Tax=Actinomyces urogenitalis TaxID=103621 RepID=UPI0024301900|nr:LacI family DNA-binding transcriptional regulator [Actinomyces urogenitalis]MCI7455869.1 LacI family transcriptional regulator [Actinomyces urogenitalis]
MTMVGRATLEDVARAAGVSRATASRVVRGDGGVSPKKTKAVQAAITALGYVPNSAARALVSSRMNTVAVVIPEADEMVFTDPFIVRTVQAISRELDAADIQLIMAFADHAGAGRRTANYLRTGSVDGVIVISHHRFSGQVEALMSAQIPVVFVGRRLAQEPPQSWVDIDNAEAGRMAARHLLAHGAKRPSIITGPLDMVSSHDRLVGFREVMGDEGIAPLVLEGAFTAESGRAAGEALAPRIESGETDAVFACSDLMAMAAMEAWRRRGIVAPRDVKIVSCDNSPEAARAEPPLSSLENPAEVLGARATQMLLEILAGSWDGEPVMLATGLVERESC